MRSASAKSFKPLQFGVCYSCANLVACPLPVNNATKNATTQRQDYDSAAVSIGKLSVAIMRISVATSPTVVDVITACVVPSDM